MAKRESEPTPEILAAFRPENCTPDDVEKLIDYRVAQIDEEITEHQTKVEELRAERKRWIGVTGGRSRLANDDEEKP